MLEALIRKARRTSSTTWRWILGVLIALLAAVGLWALRRQQHKIAKLRVETTILKDEAKDVAVLSEAQQRTEEAERLRQEATRMIAKAAKKEEGIKELEDEARRQKKRIVAARTWKELEQATKETQ